MKAEQILVVRQTWAQVMPIGDAAATLFYQRLFEIDPSIHALFHKVDMPAQRRRLLDAVGFVVERLDSPETLAPVLADLGRRHDGYGVKRVHYETVGEALLWTLEQGLGDAWTPTARAAWHAAYSMISGIMQRAAEAPDAPRARRVGETAAASA